MIQYPAIIPEPGRIVSVLREGEVICRCECLRESIGGGSVLTQLYSNSAYALVSKTKVIQQSRYAGMIWFNLDSGKYEKFLEFTSAAELNEIFEGTVAVDEYNLTIGLVPDSFKNIPGYASNILKFEELIKAGHKVNPKEESYQSGLRYSDLFNPMHFSVQSIGFFI
jgi:hypothetical protein